MPCRLADVKFKRFNLKRWDITFKIRVSFKRGITVPCRLADVKFKRFNLHFIHKLVKSLLNHVNTCLQPDTIMVRHPQGPPSPGSAIPRVRYPQGPPSPGAAIPRVRYPQGPPSPGDANPVGVGPERTLQTRKQLFLE